MNRLRLAGTAAVLAALLIAPALAQQAGQPSTPSDQRQAASLTGGTVQKSQNSWRGRTLVGTPVFNDSGQRIATINDLLITDDGRVDQVVLAVRRMRGKLVTVPFSQVRFSPSSGTLVAPPDTGMPTFSGDKTFAAVLPGATRDSLAKMEPFRFAP